MDRKKLDPTLNTDLGLQIGQIDVMLGQIASELDGAQGQVDTTNLTVTAADASDEATAVTLVNELKTKFNTLITRLG
jgi:hypothetical protein